MARRRAPRLLLTATTVAACCLLGSTGSASVGAVVQPPLELDVDAVLDGSAELHGIDDIEALDLATSEHSGDRLVVLAESTGSAGPEVRTVTAPLGEGDALAEVIADVDGVIGVAADARVSATGVDPYAVHQYSTRRTRADRLPSWATGNGVLVAVIDSGVDASHPDLSPTLPGGRQRVLRGTVFSNGPTSFRGDSDVGTHGTHVAGVISAARGNSLGISGAAPDAQILPIRVLDANGAGWMSDVLLAIQYAHAQGADVINLSLAGALTDPAAISVMSNVIDGVRYDTSRNKPAPVIVAAAGNSGPNSPVMYPAAQPSVIAVGSTNADDRVTPTSTRGNWVDISAPGDAILSTCGSGAPSYYPTGSYCYMSGTSMASPLVAAAAALLIQQSPGRTPWTVQWLLQDAAHDIDAPGHDRSAGAGRLDIATAFDPAGSPKVPRVVSLPTGQLTSVTSSGRSIVAEGVAGDPDGSPPILIDIWAPGVSGRREVAVVGGRFGITWPVPAGEYEVCAYALDDPTHQAVFLGCGTTVVK